MSSNHSVLGGDKTWELKDFRLLDLPRELRDMIYREVLTPDISHITRGVYRLTSAILRANKQIHREASNILYNENCWVMFRTNYNIPSIAHIGGLDIQLPRLEPLDGERRFGGTPCIRIDTKADLYRHQNPGVQFICLIHDMPALCFGLRKLHSRNILSIKATIETSFWKHRQHRDRMIDCFGEIRGIANASVIGIQPSVLGDEIRNAMVTPIRSIDEILERISTYQRRGDREVANRNFQEAWLIYKDGDTYTDWARRLAFCALLPDGHISRLREVLDKSSALRVARALCTIKLGSPMMAARELIDLLNEFVLLRIERAATYHYLGLVFLAFSRRNKAAYCFLQALILHPGYEEVDQEVDILEKSLNEDSENGTRTVIANIREVLAPYRHKTAMDSILSPRLLLGRFPASHERRNALALGWVEDYPHVWDCGDYLVSVEDILI